MQSNKIKEMTKIVEKKQISLYIQMHFSAIYTYTNIKMDMTKMVNISCNVRRQKTLRTKLLRTMTSLKSPINSSASSCGSIFLLRCSRTQALYSSRFSLSLCATISSVTVTVYGPWNTNYLLSCKLLVNLFDHTTINERNLMSRLLDLLFIRK